MPEVADRLELPYTQEQLFELVADVERYPEFVPLWRAVRVREREADREVVEQVLGRRGFTWRFTTEARFRRPERIRIASRDVPFRYLVLLWGFRSVGDGHCRVSYRARYELRRLPMRRVLETLFSDSLGQVVGAFEARAHRLYGGAQRPRDGAPAAARTSAPGSGRRRP